MNKAKVLMFQGTSSHVGKSVIATSFCRLIARRGFRVAPFKAMNMSNNAWVTKDGGEIAFAQAVQAKACGIEPTVQMNPVLLKTMSDNQSQVILQGRPFKVVKASGLHRIRAPLMGAIDSALKGLLDQYDFLVVEGAGSPAEVNLKATDLANMRVAKRASARVILVADIERGGVFAQLVGTLQLLSPKERSLIDGFLINKFRGDPSLLQSGIRWLERKTGKPVLGVIPYLPDLRIPEEDSLADRLTDPALRQDPKGLGKIRIQVIRYPTIANFTDFDPLQKEPDVYLEYLTRPPSDGKVPELMILPGSRSTMAALQWLRNVGLDRTIKGALQEGCEVLGICGGFQMLGEMLYDPAHVESKESSMQGLRLLPISTLFLNPKITAQVKGWDLKSGEPVFGYEIHLGRLQGARRGNPVFRITERGGVKVEEYDGCQIPERKVWGTYLHGLFDSPGFRSAFLRRFSPDRDVLPLEEVDPIERLADGVARATSWEKFQEAIPWIPLS